MQRALKKASIQWPMHIARDGREALDYLQANGKYAGRADPSLIFLDLKLPFVHGFQVPGVDWQAALPERDSCARPQFFP